MDMNESSSMTTSVSTASAEVDASSSFIVFTPATDDDEEEVEVINHRAAADTAGFLPEFDILVRFGYAPANVFQALTTENE